MKADLREFTALSDMEKQNLAYDLLVELGATNIKRSGDELIHGCLTCPHHTDQDRNPTASLNWSRLLVNCFSGGGGSVLWLIATVRNCSIDQARQWLAGEAGLNRAMELPALLDLFDNLYTTTRPEPAPVYSERILRPWQAAGVPTAILDRGVPRETAERAGVCVAPAGALTDPRVYPGAGPRLVIPHWWKGKLVGWQSRRIDNADGTPKYLATPGLPKDTTLFGHQPGPRQRRAVIVEAPISSLRHHHHQPMLATFGSEISDQQLTLIAAHYDEAVFWMDPDKAGWDAVEGRIDKQGRAIPGRAELLSRRIGVLVVECLLDADPADLDDATVGEHVAAAVPWSIWERPTVDQLICHRCLGPSHPERKAC